MRPASAAQAPEVLYNGITLGSPWPPQLRYPDEHPVLAPYLADPPAIVPIDVGRQLFVDDFLIEDTTLSRTCHKAEYHPGNPILRPETPWEIRDDASERNKLPLNPAAMVFSDGVFFDPRDRIYKMWYMAGYGAATGLATSTDGIAWQRPKFDVVPGTNTVNAAYRDSTTVWLDLFDKNPRARYKMSAWYDHYLLLYTSPDGIHWTEIGRTGAAGDRSTCFYNPFRNVWVFSIRDNQVRLVDQRALPPPGSPDFMAARKWDGRQRGVGEVRFRRFRAAGAGGSIGDLQPRLRGLRACCSGCSDLARRSAVREDQRGRRRLQPRRLHWHRPDRGSLMPVSGKAAGTGRTSVCGGGCFDRGRSAALLSAAARAPRNGIARVCSTGLATLRRDGSARWTGCRTRRRSRASAAHHWGGASSRRARCSSTARTCS